MTFSATSVRLEPATLEQVSDGTVCGVLIASSRMAITLLSTDQS
jgi:hypothetical protein